MSAAGYYAYQRSNQQEDHEEQSNIVRTASRTSSNTSASRRSSSSASTPRRVLVNHDNDDDNTSAISQSSASSSSSSTILAPRPRSSRHESSTVPSSVQRTPTATPATQIASDEERRCWICFGEDGDSEGNWVKPCKCSLVSHEQCLLDWITENQKGSPLKKVYCPQCNTPYYLTEQKSLPLALLTLVDSLVQTATPYLTVLGLGCSVTLTSATYGVYTVLTLFGAREGQRLLGHPATWTYRTWIGLPCIPAALILSRSRWADGVLPFAAMLLLRATYANQHPPIQMSWPPSPALTLGILPWIRLLYNNLYLLAQHHLSRKLIHLRRSSRQQQQQQQPQTTTLPRPATRGEPITAGDGNGTSLQAFRQELHRYNADILGDPLWEEQQNERRRREELEREERAAQDQREREADALMNGREHSSLGITVMGALLWPTISSLVGSILDHFRLVRQYFPEPFHRNILGGCLFVVAKDLANLFYKYERIKQRQSRRIKNYNEVMQK